ncbi:hypothetical protein BH10BDE1_BH10BDE1_24180 [soil metagenome]
MSKTNSSRNRGFASRLLIGLSSAVCIILFQNCGADFVPMSDSDFASLGKFVCGSTLEESFGKSYKPFFTSATCISCHGSTQSPKFALADTGLAYTEFQKTTQTNILAYAQNPNHGGGAGGPKNSAAITAAQSNFDSCKSGGGGGAVAVVTARTQAMVLGATATATLKSYLTLDSQLDLGATNLGGAKLYFQVSLNTAGAVPTYIIARPSLATGTSTVAVKGITIRINGVTIPAATAFMNVDKVINPGTNPLAGQVPNGNLSLGSSIFEYPGANGATDTIQIEFQTLKAQ